jgi:iron-sulfur cluster repair protein YtfE (RIC family)
MTKRHHERDEATPPPLDGFDALDVCHRQSLLALGKLAALVSRLESIGSDADARALAAEVAQHFSTTSRRHHKDEERYVFPALLKAGDLETVQAILRLQQDHDWIEEDWMELSPHLDALASGQSCYDVDLLREGASVFTALMHDHIGLEESLIYPQARARLDADGRYAMGREMAARRRAERSRDRADKTGLARE